MLYSVCRSRVTSITISSSRTRCVKATWQRLHRRCHLHSAARQRRCSPSAFVRQSSLEAAYRPYTTLHQRHQYRKGGCSFVQLIRLFLVWQTPDRAVPWSDGKCRKGKFSTRSQGWKKWEPGDLYHLHLVAVQGSMKRCQLPEKFCRLYVKICSFD